MTWLSEPGRAKPLPPSTATLRVAAGLAALSLAVAALPCAAQVVISNQGRGEVTVNSDVLDALGPSPTLPQLIDPRLAGSRTARGLATPRVSQSESVPRSRVYQLPPAPGSANPPPAGYVPSVAAPPSVASSTPAPLRRPVAAAPAPRVARAPAPAPSTPPSAPARTASAAPAPASVTTSAPPSASPSAPATTPASIPPIPPERTAPRAPIASAPPPPPYTPPPPAPVVRPAAVASPPPSPPPSAPAAARTVVPPPSAAPAALASAGATQMASAGALSRVLFAPGSADLNDDGKQALAQLVTRLEHEGDSRIQLLAYADGNAENESQARRLSLSRALAVRAYLIDQGIRSTRVNVQALGIKSAGGPPDRVDAMAATP